MKLYLFDQILETHVVDALSSALLAEGHSVTLSGPVWQGHRFPERPEDISMIHEKIDEMLAEQPDAMFNFRASSLLPEHILRIRKAGVRTIVWFPDDPVLYNLVYGKIIDLYDIPLHCGDQRVLNFYHYHGHTTGINFPFWLDPAVFNYVYDPSAATGNVVFFGNMHGPIRQGRYDIVCSSHTDVSIYGKVASDPRGRVKGIINGPAETVKVLGTYRIGINIAQEFSSYANTQYDYPGLAMLGAFFLPSRVLQYASTGLPVVTVQTMRQDDAHCPPGFHARDAESAGLLIKRLLEHPDYLVKISKAARRIVEQRFSGRQRVKLLEYLLTGQSIADFTMHEREMMYQWF